ncbi:MAG: YheV family putative metal-binding protein [Oscillospiraceae bacterium]|nr:YheV family putative metal-binding protein [Oscillospiraceae bacterium]
MENKLNDENLEEISGGQYAPRHSNFCPRCRNTGYTVLWSDSTIEHRRCNTCQLEYDYRKW